MAAYREDLVGTHREYIGGFNSSMSAFILEGLGEGPGKEENNKQYQN